MTNFLIQCGMLPTVSYAAPFVADMVKLVYANITKKFIDITSKQYGRVYVRGNFYDITPARINLIVGMHEVLEDDDDLLDNMNEVTNHITGGKVQEWSSSVKVSDLTAMHNVLHKLTITNWLPSSNSTSVTHSQAILIYKLSCGVKIDFGQMVFKRIYHEAKSKSQSGILPYPFLIYKLICSKDFIKEMDDPLTSAGIFKISPSYVSGECVVDLPWVDPCLPQRSNADDDDSVESGMETLPVPLAFLRQELERCDERIQLFSSQLRQAQDMRSKLVILLSSQKGGENGGEGGSSTAEDEQVQGGEGQGGGAAADDGVEAAGNPNQGANSED